MKNNHWLSPSPDGLQSIIAEPNNSALNVHADHQRSSFEMEDRRYDSGQEAPQVLTSPQNQMQPGLPTAPTAVILDRSHPNDCPHVREEERSPSKQPTQNFKQFQI